MKMNGNMSSLKEFDFIAYSPASVALLSLARRLAKINVPVLITGESGTGKECVAKYIHHHAFHHEAPYVGVNCAAIPENMLEAILFGYEKGAFTGAIASQPGKFEQANGGTLLLDEIGDMPMALQAKLLRVLQERKVERLGSHKTISLDIRLIAATNKDLAVVPVPVTPLRKRKEDIIPLTELFIEKYRAFSSSHPWLTASARQALLAHDWPGNVRELENAVQRGLIMCESGVLEADCLGLVPPLVQPLPVVDFVEQNPIKQRGKIAEFQYITDLLNHYHGNKSRTAAFLGITPCALRYRLASMREQGFNDVANVFPQESRGQTM